MKDPAIPLRTRRVGVSPLYSSRDPNYVVDVRNSCSTIAPMTSTEALVSLTVVRALPWLRRALSPCCRGP